LLTSEFWADGCFLKFLFTLEETASSMSPTKVSSFNAVSARNKKNSQRSLNKSYEKLASDHIVEENKAKALSI